MKTNRQQLIVFYLVKFIIGIISKHFLVLYMSGIIVAILILITAHQYNFGGDIFIYLENTITNLGFQVPEGSYDEKDLYVFTSKLIFGYAAVELLLLFTYYEVFGYAPKKKKFNPRIILNLSLLAMLYLVGLFYLFTSQVFNQDGFSIIFFGFIAYIIHVCIFFLHVLFSGVGHGIIKEKIEIEIKF